VTAQHRELLDQALSAFGLEPEFDLDLMHPGQGLAELSSRLISGLNPVLSSVKPSLSIVQGDTATSFCASLASFYSGVPVAHVEAGLRTHDPQAPFPEEMNRHLIGRLASLHFAPTRRAAENLRAEGVVPEAIEVTGNTGVDALFEVREALNSGALKSAGPPLDSSKKLIVITAHRRESFGPALYEVCRAIAELSQRKDVEIVWPVHPNPQVRAAVRETGFDMEAVNLVEPLDYVSFVDLLQNAYIVITDSGGVQEEVPAFGKPILVLRETTERPEGVEAGIVKLVGTSAERIVKEASRLLDNPAEYREMAQIKSPYGDGRASARIAARLCSFLGV